MTRRGEAPGWTVVVPVKSLTAAKTRLAPELGPAERAALARAFALDTIDAARAARAVERVVVVSDEPVVEHELRGVPGVDVVPEFGPRGLAAAISHGVAVARGAGRAGAVAVLLGDLPGVGARDLDAALEAAARHPLAFVADADGTGTTLATALADVPMTAHFGPDSAALHRAAGFADLVAEQPTSIAPGLRRDVDTGDELREAIGLGVRARTAAVVRGLAERLSPDDGRGPRHPLDPPTAPTGAAIAPHGADRKAAS
ncbi:2-phospho-L-lactate guanylyltransferase [Agromyces kandeliae]|uniref:Phosphoenolpyruvate guanylyltransferase n=1 Tax=Agromyces kandeliae TaxID=2666141 RepID=A0A6L5R0Q7_9MICO|nr:2-phospho-L-lactate guanylyltransferase [Agromyces kandeliae]MRX43570.1 2-phospho-L-lactate guanylyltransferase [Agromyces kandeliae]